MIETSFKNWNTQENEENQLSTISGPPSALNRDNTVQQLIYQQPKIIETISVKADMIRRMTGTK